MYRYRIQKQVLPIGAAAGFHLLAGTSELLFQIFASFRNLFNELVTSRQLFSSTFIPPHILLTVVNSHFISFFSSQLLSTRVDSPHLSCTCPILSQPSRSDSVANFLAQLSWIAFPLYHGFNSPLSSWQPDHIDAGLKQTCLLNMPAWPCADQLNSSPLNAPHGWTNKHFGIW